MDKVNNKTLVYIEDSLEIREIVESLLRSLNVSIIECNDFNEATEVIGNRLSSNKPVDLIITDINMPNLSIENFLTILRDKFKLNIPVIINSSDEDRILEIKNKFEVFCVVDKPFEVDELLTAVNSALQYSPPKRAKVSVE